MPCSRLTQVSGIFAHCLCAMASSSAMFLDFTVCVATPSLGPTTDSQLGLNQETVIATQNLPVFFL